MTIKIKRKLILSKANKTVSTCTAEDYTSPLLNPRIIKILSFE